MAWNVFCDENELRKRLDSELSSAGFDLDWNTNQICRLTYRHRSFVLFTKIAKLKFSISQKAPSSSLVIFHNEAAPPDPTVFKRFVSVVERLAEDSKRYVPKRERKSRPHNSDDYGFNSDELDAFNHAAQVESEHISGTDVAKGPSLDTDYSLFLMFGQSLSIGAECWPAKSLEPVDDIFMIGDGVRPRDPRGPNFVPVNGSRLVPMRGSVQFADSGDLADPEQTAAFAPGDRHLGETPLEGALRYAMRRRRNDQQAMLRRSAFIGCATGVEDCTVEMLSFKSAQGLFERNRQAAVAAKQLVDAEQKSINFHCLFFLQGEFNSHGLYHSTSDRKEYRRLVEKLYRDINSEITQKVFMQSDEPLMITYQSNGPWTAADLAIAMAQFDSSIERDNWYLAAPTYPVTNKGGHLDANGSRWLGVQLGKIWYRVAVEGKNWRPLSPLRAHWRGRNVAIEFHVPCPPLQFKAVYNWNVPQMTPDRGFVIQDDDGIAEILRVSLAAGHVVSIMVNRTLRGDVVVSYASRQAKARGNLCDSDDTVSFDRFDYRAGSGDAETANIPGLVDKPYPLWNFCIAFIMKAEWKAVDPVSTE